jgi:hypothetical protein
VARVEWSRLSGDETEAVLGIMLCREHRTATRVKPSRGDGGIDIWVPEGDTAIVYQVKSYTGNIDPSRLAKIKKSWETLLDYAAKNSITLSAWYLVMPENPTTGQLEWLGELTKGVGFPCIWRGLEYVDGLAAKYPEVVDYYLRDGKDRLETTVQRLLSIGGLKNPAAFPVESIDSLRELHEALNQFDPHFYYDFSVQMLNADGTAPPAQLTAGTIASVRLTSNGRAVTYNIIPRFNEALKERPVPGSMTLTAEPGTPLHKQIDGWARYGAALTDVPAKKVQWDLPGGFGGSYEDVRITISATKPLPGSAHEVVTLRVLGDGGKVEASLDFVTEEASSGSGGNAIRTVGHDTATGLVRYELRLDRDVDAGKTAANLDIAVEDPWGRSPRDMIPGLQFLIAVQPSRQIQIFSRNGPALIPPISVDKELLPEQQGRLWILMCESLATIQEHVLDRIGFPDIPKHHAENYWDVVEEWYLAARLLRGEVITTTWERIGMHLLPGVDPSAVTLAATMTKDLDVVIGPTLYQLGTTSTAITSVKVNPDNPPVAHGDHFDLQLVPDADNTVTIRLISDSPAVGSPVPLPSSS